MTFYIPPVFLFGNKVRHIRNNQEKNKAEYKTATETEIQIENRNIKRIEELKEENETLKKENELLKECNIRNYTGRRNTDDMNLKLLEENKILKEDNDKLQAWPFKYSYIKKIQKQNKQLEQENKTLKDKIEFLTKCLDDRDKSIELLKEELEQYKKQYEHSMWEDYIDEDLYDLDC